MKSPLDLDPRIIGTGYQMLIKELLVLGANFPIQAERYYHNDNVNADDMKEFMKGLEEVEGKLNLVLWRALNVPRVIN